MSRSRTEALLYVSVAVVVVLANDRNQNSKEQEVMAMTKILVSYDFDNDKALYDFIIGQARLPDSPFEVSDHSLKEAAPEKGWQVKAHAAISHADRFIVMLGSRTRYAAGVKQEVAMAKALGKPRFQVIGYRDGSKDWALPDAGATYVWSWDTLKKLLA